MKKISLVLLVIGIVLLLFVVLMVFKLYKPTTFSGEKDVYSFDSCVEAGFNVLETLPRQCMTSSGTFYIDEEENRELGLFNSCQTDVDCIPLPNQCHPTSCINKEHENLFIDKSNITKACTQIFMSVAAYLPEDCICQNNICTNKNFD